MRSNVLDILLFQPLLAVFCVSEWLGNPPKRGRKREPFFRMSILDVKKGQNCNPKGFLECGTLKNCLEREGTSSDKC